MRFSTILILSVLVVILLGAFSPAFSAPFNGSIALQAPALDPDRLQDDSAQVCLDLRLPNVLGPLSFFTRLEHSLRDDFPYTKENKLRLGGDIPLHGNLSLYSFWERRYSTDQNRVVVGCKLSFSGTY